MAPKEFEKWKQKTLLGVSLNVLAPTGQYDPTKLINWEPTGWAFQTGFGYSRTLEQLSVGWLCRSLVLHDQSGYYSPPNPKPQSEEPIGSFEGH